MPITYVVGDATSPQGQGVKVIAHLCNDESKWGRGFVLALSKKWPEPEANYKSLQPVGKLQLGTVQFVQLPGGIYVANMIGQRGIRTWKSGTPEAVPPVRYDALYNCVEAVLKFAVANSASVHAPKFGAGLAGGDWRVVEAIIEKLSSQHGVPVTIYDFPQPSQAVVSLDDEDSSDSDVI